jgi:transcription elongation factor GreB
MSRAFVKESEPDAPVELPEKAVSTLRNLMTEQGFAAMRELRDGLKEELDRCAHTDDIHARTRIAELQRDIRYYSIRLGSAEVVKCPATDAVRFGHCVSFRDQDENHYCFQIVGEDEADAGGGKISWASPLARELIGKGVSDVCTWRKGGHAEQIVITAIDHSLP